MSDTRAFLLAHAAAYPALTLTDLFKALYQSAFGCEHLVADPSAAEAYIAAEAEGARPCGRKSVEPLDGPYVRVHLDMLKKGLSARTLARLFALSAEHRDGAQAEFEKKLAVLTEKIPKASATGLMITPPPMPQMQPITDEKKLISAKKMYFISSRQSP